MPGGACARGGIRRRGKVRIVEQIQNAASARIPKAARAHSIARNLTVRRGFTLVELVVATLIGGLAASVIVATLVRQQRFVSASEERLESRNRLRDAASVLTSDLRGAAISELGVPLMTDTAVEFFSVIATSIACTAASSTIGLPPRILASGNTLTSILVQPDTGDLALLYGSTYEQPDSGSWEIHRILTFAARAASTACPTMSGFTTAADVAAGVTSWQVSVSPAPGSTVHKGAPMHFARRGRYSLYRSSDGDWYLGYRRCNAIGASVCGSIQPVSGPYHPYAKTDGTSGLTLKYFDSSGAEIGAAQSASLARIDITLRGEAFHYTGITQAAAARGVDSTTVIVSPRNRAR